MTIALLWIGEAIDDPTWSLGPIIPVGDDHRQVGAAMRRAARDSEAILIWEPSFGSPPSELVGRLLEQPVDCWHAGLTVGQGGRPSLIDHVVPTWMLNRDPDPARTATSWRITLRALLVRSRVVRQLDGPDPQFETMSGAALDLGLRWILAGVTMRHVPELVRRPVTPDPEPPLRDQTRIIARTWGPVWATWATVRSWMTGSTPRRQLPPLPTAWRTARSQTPHYEADPKRTPSSTEIPVSVIVPTIDRYSYLEELLRQLAEQTVAPLEVLVIDQTAAEARRDDLEQVAPQLPVRLVSIPSPGQCQARNAALLASSGDAILFLDDDEDIPCNLIELHLQELRPGIDAVSGGVDDATAGPPPPGFRHRRVSDVSPTGNTMARRTAIERSGLFDLAYDHGARADHDFGMRLYLTGALMIYDPAILIFHHHAPRGGLRTHGARAVTRAGSRRRVSQRDLPGVTESYLALRYYTAAQVREQELIKSLSQLRGHGSAVQRCCRFIVQAALLPDTMRRIRRTRLQAAELLKNRPTIPRLPSSTGADNSDLSPG